MMNSDTSISSLSSSTNSNSIVTPNNGSVSSIAMASGNNPNLLIELCESKCLSPYLQTKIGVSYESVKTSLKEATEKKNSSKIYSSLQNLTYYKVEKDLLDVMLSIVSMTDDKKTLRLAYYFLVEISQFKNLINSSTEIKAMTNIFNKEMLHKDISRKVINLKTTAQLAPNDVLVDANILEVISGILRKVGEDVDKTQKKKGFFSRGTNDLGRERSLLQYACFVACRNRFKNNPSLFMPIVEGIKCSDPVGARHSISLTYEYSLEKAATVSESTKRFLPLLKSNKGKEAVNLIDPFARRNFIKLSGHLASTNVPESKDFFQNICQSVQDNHLAVSFWAIQTLCKFPWSKLESSFIEPIILDNDTPNHYDAIPNQITLVSGICNKLKTVLSNFTQNSTNQSNPILHLACKLVSLLSESFVKSTYPKDSKSQQPVIGEWVDFEVLDNITSESSGSGSHIINNSGGKEPVWNTKTLRNPSNTGTIKDNNIIDPHPFSNLKNIIMSLLAISPSISIRIQALKALVWLCPSDLHHCKLFKDLFKAQLLDPYHPSYLFKELFNELLKRISATPVLSPMVMSLIYDWIDIVPPKVDTTLITQTLRLIIDFGKEAKEKLLSVIFKILDRSVHPDFRVTALEIEKDLVRFLGDHSNQITFESPSRYNESTTQSGAIKQSKDIQNQSLNSIILRLEQYAIFNPWQIRLEAVDALARIAFLSCSAIRVQIYNFLVTVPNESHGWTAVKSNTSLIVNILDQLLTKRAKWLQLIKTNSNLTESQKKDLNQDHINLQLQISVFFEQNQNQDFLPLGLESKSYLSK